MMYLLLSVAGHLTIFQTRTRGPFWSIRPAPILLVAVPGTQIIATVIAVSGLLMTRLGWGWAVFVWGYAVAWFLVIDRVKLVAYRVLDPAKAVPPLRAKSGAPSDLAPQIATRVYELYKAQGRHDGHAVQDGTEAGREARKDATVN